MLAASFNNLHCGHGSEKMDSPSRSLRGLYIFGDYKRGFESFDFRCTQQEFSKELSEGTDFAGTAAHKLSKKRWLCGKEHYAVAIRPLPLKIQMEAN